MLEASEAAPVRAVPWPRAIQQMEMPVRANQPYHAHAGAAAVAARAEYDKEGIALGIDFDATMRPKGVAQQRALGCQKFGAAVAQSLDRRCAGLDVREQQR